MKKKIGLRTLLVAFLVFSMEFTSLDCALAEEKDNTHKYNKISVEEKVKEHHYKNKIAERYREDPPRGWEKGKKEGWQGGDLPPGLGKKHEELERLRKEDPEKFRKILAAHKQEMEKRLEALKKTDPEKYERIMREKKEHRFEDVRDRREDVRDRREDIRDRREDIRDRREDIKDRPHIERKPPLHDKELHKGYEKGVRDYGKGMSQGGMHRGGGGPKR